MSDQVEQINVPEGETTYEQSTEIFASDEIKQNLKDYLVKELSEVDTDAGRKVRMERNQKIKRQRIGRPASETKDFPWANASNVVPPMVLQKTNTVATKMMSTLLDKKPLFTYDADPPYTPPADALTRFVQYLLESPYGLDFYKKIWTIVYDACSMGTKFIKVPFEVKKLQFKRIGADGGAEEVDRIISALPQIRPIPFEDFMIRPEWTDLQTAPWCGVRYYKFYHELKALAQQGYYSAEAVELIIDGTTTLDDHKKADLTAMGLTESGSTEKNNNIYKIYEVNVFWDADDNGFSEDLIVTFEADSGEILRAEYNDIGIRDYSRLPYIELPDNIYGLGVGEMLMSLQDEIETLHNMRIDASLLSLNPVQVISESADQSGDEGIYPGKKIKVPNAREDFAWQIVPDMGRGAIQAEQFSEAYADKATGASQALSGGDVGGSNRIGATGTKALMGQSMGFLDAIATQLSHRLPEIAMLILYQMVRNGELIDVEGQSEADKILLSEVFGMSVEDIPGKFKFRARLSSVQDSKESKQQAAMGLFQVYNMYIDKSIQISSQLSNPQLQQMPKLQEIMTTGMVGLTTLMENMLKNYDEDNVGDYLPFIEDMKLILRQQDTARQQEVDTLEAGISQQQAGATGQGLPGDDQLGGNGGANMPQGEQPQGVQGAGPTSGAGETIGGPEVL
jgi:hypothetical protein